MVISVLGAFGKLVFIIGLSLLSKHAYADYKPGYESLLKTYRVKPEWSQIVETKAQQMFKNRERYITVSTRTNVPWTFIAVIHNLESGGSFSTHLHNGDPLTARTKRVPKGYPKTGKPPFTWEDSAVDALMIKSFQLEDDWSDVRVCYNLEKYNGFGYRSANINSPYLWSGTDKYRIGKYVADGKYDPNHVSGQIGAIPLYKRLQALEKEAIKEEARQAHQVLKENSRSYQALDAVTGFFKWAATGIAGLGVTEYLGWINNFLTTWKGVATLGGLLLVTWAVISYIKSRKKEEFKDGRYTPSGLKNAEVSTE
jgi:lysozyme family protein